MDFVIIMGLIIFTLLCLRKSINPALIFTDTERRPRQQAENKPLPLIEFKTNPRIIRTPDRHAVVEDDDCFFI